MTPTRLRTLAALLLGAGVVAYALAATSYDALPQLPGYAPVSLVLLVLVELGMAKVVRDRVHRRLLSPRARPLHPMQVARAAALAKASSAGGALLAGAYGGIFAWTAPRRDEVAVYADDALVAGVSLVASAALVGAALLLERACRVPAPPEDGPGADRGTP